MYAIFVVGWGQVDVFIIAAWQLAADPMLNGVISSMVQSYFAWRLHIIARQPRLTTFIIACSCVSLFGGFGTGAGVLWLKEYALLGNLKVIGTLWVLGALVADLTITCAMSYHLRRHKSDFEAMDDLLNRIIQREC